MNKNSFLKRYFYGQKTGFTLIEIVVVIGIISVIGTIVYQFVVQGNDIFIQTRDQALAQDTLRKVMDSLAKELREARSADNGAYLLEQTVEQSIIFYSDIDNDNKRERLRYFLSAIDFKKGVIEPVGAQYPQGNEVITTVVSNIRNTGPIFTYYDENYTGTQSPLSQPVNIAQVRLVHLQFIVDIDPLQPPSPITIETSVAIRNLKTNL